MLNKEIVKGFQSTFKDDIDKRIKDQDAFKTKAPKKTIVIHKKDGTISRKSSDLDEKYLEDIEDITFEFKYTVRIENYSEIYNIEFDHTDYFQYKYNSICLEKITYENFMIFRRDLSKYSIRDIYYVNPATFKFSIVIRYSDYKKELNKMFLNLNT